LQLSRRVLARKRGRFYNLAVREKTGKWETDGMGADFHKGDRQ